MTRSYRPSDQDKHPASDPNMRAEERPLPIDLAYGFKDDPVTWQELSPACWAAVVGLAVAILGSFAILWVVYG